MTEAAKVIWALADRRKHWQDHAPEDGQHEFHWEKYHHTDTVAALEAKVARLEAALREIEERHMPSEPMTWGGSEYDWALRQYGNQRNAARKALDDTQ